MPDITVGVNRDMRGGLDSDTDVNYLNGGNYPDCVNVERNNDSTGGSDTPSLGNTLEYTLPIVQKQSQKVRVYDTLSEYTEPYNYIRMSLYNANGQLVVNSYLSVNNPLYNISTFSGIRNAVASRFGTEPWNEYQGQVFSVQNDGNSLFFDVSVTFGYADYTLELVPGIVGSSRTPPAWTSGAFTGNDPIVDDVLEFDPFTIRVIQEAYSESEGGKLHLIGSKEINSKLFMTWTTQTEEKSKVPTVIDGLWINTTDLIIGYKKIYVLTGSRHGFYNFQTIVLANLTGEAAAYNGRWNVIVVDDFTFYLLNTVVNPNIPESPTFFGGELWINNGGVGVIVAQTYSVDEDKYEYVYPLRSKQFNWNTKHQIDLDVEYFNDTYSLYYTDNYNRPRVTYIPSDIQTDCCIEALNEQGQYEYEVLAEQIILQQNNSSNIQITILDQVQGGGSLYSGSYRYGVVLVTESETETEISELSGIIRVYPPLYEEGAMIYGDYGNSAVFASTTKINKIQVDGIPAGVFKYIDLICVIIDGQDDTTLTSTQTLVVSRTLLGPDETTISLEHSGNEVDIRNFSLGSLNPVKETVLKAYNNVIGENRLLISNFVTTQNVDIAEWVDTFKYSIKRQGVYSDGLGENYLGFASPSQNYGGIDAPVGYQLYEWYRFYVVAEYKEGGFTDAFFCFDVRFVTQQDYSDSIGTDDDFSFPTTNVYDRRDFNGDDLITYHLSETQDSGRFRYQWGIELKNIDWEYSIDGIKVKDIIKRVFVYRAERIDEVLASGNTVMSVKKREFRIVESNNPDVPATPTYTIIPNKLFDYPFSIKQNSTYGQVTAESYDQPYSLQTDLRQMKYGSFYSMDYLYQPQLFAFRPLDQIVFLGCSRPAFTDRYYSGGPANDNEDNYLRIFKNPSTGSFQNAIIRNLVDFKFIGTNSDQAFGTEGITYIKKIPPANQEELFTYLRVYINGQEEFPLPLSNVSRLQERSLYGLGTGSPVFQLDEEINVSDLGDDYKRFYDYGVYLSVHFRKRSNKYGTRAANNNILSTNYVINFGESSKIVFGGDVYSQGSYMKKQYFSNYDGSDSENAKGGSASCLMLSQNRINTQLRTLIPNLPNLIYPQQIPDWQTWSLKLIIQQEYYNYNSGYLEIKNQQLVPAFDPELITRTTFPTRIIYSELKPNSSVKDFYRLFPPGQFRDNPNNFGAIVHMDLKQGELFTLQELCYTREFLNSTGQLATVDSGQVIIGDSSVLSRPGIRLTQLGSKHKWSYARGLTDAGTDVRCWVNSDFFVILRAGRDGTVNLTERSFMDTYLRDHMRFVKDKFTPADGQGIAAVWDDVGKNFIITCRGWIRNVQWEESLNRGYKPGTIVREGELYGVPVLYKCLIEEPFASEVNKPGTPQGENVWQKIEFSDINYYSVFTIAFNEARNRFTHFQTFYPKIYANHFDRYFSPNPYEGASNEFYLMRDGEPLVFYNEEHEGYTEYVINQEPSILKKFVALGYNSTLKPYKVEMRTQFISEEGIDDRYTYLNRDEFRMRENIAFSTIKNSVNEEGETDKRSAPMKGLWLKLKTFFKAREYQKINDIFVPIRTGQRNVKNP